MICNVLAPRTMSIEPGDSCEIGIGHKASVRRVKVNRVIETNHGVYVVFDDQTWRPLSTHGITWRVQL